MLLNPWQTMLRNGRHCVALVNDRVGLRAVTSVERVVALLGKTYARAQVDHVKAKTNYAAIDRRRPPGGQ